MRACTAAAGRACCAMRQANGVQGVILLPRKLMCVCPARACGRARARERAWHRWRRARAHAHAVTSTMAPKRKADAISADAPSGAPAAAAGSGATVVHVEAWCVRGIAVAWGAATPRCGRAAARSVMRVACIRSAVRRAGAATRAAPLPAASRVQRAHTSLAFTPTPFHATRRAARADSCSSARPLSWRGSSRHVCRARPS